MSAATANAGPADTNTLDNAYNAAQRAKAILALIFDGFLDSIPNENVQTALYSVQREVDEVLGIVEALNWPDESEADTDANFKAEAQAAGQTESAGDSGLFNKLFRFAESVAEQAAGIDVELKRYRAEVAEQKESSTDTHPSGDFVEVAYWADNHLLAAGSFYRLVDNATKEILVEFEADTLDDAKDKCAAFIRYGSIKGAAGKGHAK